MHHSHQSEIQAAITAEIEKTKKAIADYKEMSKPVAPDDAIGRISRIDAINNKSVTEAALRTAEQKLKALEQMQTKVGNKDFGLCARCNRPIPIQRILLVPQSRFCVNCAS